MRDDRHFDPMISFILEKIYWLLLSFCPKVRISADSHICCHDKSPIFDDVTLRIVPYRNIRFQLIINLIRIVLMSVPYTTTIRAPELLVNISKLYVSYLPLYTISFRTRFSIVDTSHLKYFYLIFLCCPFCPLLFRQDLVLHLEVTAARAD